MNRVLLSFALLFPSACFAGGFGHVFVLVEENREYSSVVGDTVNAPWFNSIIRRYALATNSYADTHPSIGNYFMLTTGQVFTNNDSYTGTFSGDNLVRQCVASGISWRSYAEGFTTRVSYADKHNVFVFFSDVQNSSAQMARIVETDSLASDIADHRLPRIGFIAPNLIDDGHDGTLLQSDNWARSHIGPLIASPDFQADGVLIITWDEGVNDNTHGGGHVCTVVVSPSAKSGYRSTQLYQHESTLRFVMQAAGMTSFPGAAATATDMTEFFAASSAPRAGVPVDGAFSLSQNYPNPFNPSTRIRYYLPAATHVELSVYDQLGRKVSSLVNERQDPGDHDAEFDGSGFASGTYFCRITAGTFSRTRPLVLMK